MNIPEVEILADIAVTRSSKLGNLSSISCSMEALCADPGILPAGERGFDLLMSCLLVRARIIAVEPYLLRPRLPGEGEG